MSSVREIEVLLRAAYPIICVRSGEEDRVESALIGLINRRNNSLGTSSELWTWSITDGATHTKTNSSNDELAMPLTMLDYITEYAQSGVFLLKDFHHYFKDDAPGGITVQRKLKDLARRLTSENSGKHIIIVGNFDEIPKDLENLVAVLDFDLPQKGDIEDVVFDSLTMAGLESEMERFSADATILD